MSDDLDSYVAATLDAVCRTSAADLLHQFAMAALPGAMQAFAKHWPDEKPDFDWIADQAYGLARVMVKTGKMLEEADSD